MAPVLLLRQRSFHCCTLRSSAASPSPYRPRLKLSPPRLLTAVVTNTRSPHTIGLEWARPGVGLFQAMLAPLETFQVAGKLFPSATPAAPGPRNDGQFCAAAVEARRSAPTRVRSEEHTSEL